MSDNDWKTIRVPKDVYEDAKSRKKEHGVTWGEYVNPHAWHSVFDEPKGLPSERAASNIDAMTNASQEDIDEAVRQIKNRLDDLEGQALERQQSIDVEDARILSQHVEKGFAPYFADIDGVDDPSDLGNMANTVEAIEERLGSLEKTLEDMGMRP